MFDLIIVGGSVAGISCGLVLGSAAGKEYMKDKKIGMISYHKSADLNAAVVNNCFGVKLGTNGKELLEKELEKLKSFSSIEQLAEEVVLSVLEKEGYYEIKTKENNYRAKNVVLAIGHNPKMAKIEGLEEYVIKHELSLEGVKKSALKNSNNIVKEGLYVAGLTNGCASQIAIAAGSGAEVAVQLLTKWNGGKFDHYHDK